MGINFEAFDSKVNMDELQKEVEKAEVNEYKDVPDGTYMCSIEKIEIKDTKDHKKLMFAVQCKIKEGEHKGRMIFFNRTITGNTSPKWTDAMSIKSVITWLDKLETNTVPEFFNYADFATCVLDIFQEVQGKIEIEVDYKKDDFNPISINEVYDC